MSDVLTVVYPGVSEKARKGQLSTVEGISDLDKHFYPREPKREFYYYNKKRDSDAEKVRKARRRKDYRALRKQEVVDGLTDMDSVLETCGMVFPKGEPVEVDLERLNAYETEKLHIWLKKKRLLHVDDWKRSNETAEEKAERLAAEKAAADAKVKADELAKQKLLAEAKLEAEAAMAAKEKKEAPKPEVKRGGPPSKKA